MVRERARGAGAAGGSLLHTARAARLAGDAAGRLASGSDQARGQAGRCRAGSRSWSFSRANTRVGGADTCTAGRGSWYTPGKRARANRLQQRRAVGERPEGGGGAVQGVPVKAAALRFIEEWIYSLVQAHLEVQPTKSIMTEMIGYRLKCWRFYVRRLRFFFSGVVSLKGVALAGCRGEGLPPCSPGCRGAH